MENTKNGMRREGRWTLIRVKAQDTIANPNCWETHLVRKRWDIGLLRALSLRIMMTMLMMTYTYMYVKYIYIYTYTYNVIHTYISMHVRLCMCEFMHAFMYVCTYVRLYVCV